VGHLIADEAGQLAVNGGASLTSLFYVSLFTVVRTWRHSRPILQLTTQMHMAMCRAVVLCCRSSFHATSHQHQGQTAKLPHLANRRH